MRRTESIKVPSRSNRNVRSGVMRGNVAGPTGLRPRRAISMLTGLLNGADDAADRARRDHGGDHLQRPPRGRGPPAGNPPGGGRGSLAPVAPHDGRMERSGRPPPGERPAGALTPPRGDGCRGTSRAAPGRPPARTKSRTAPDP